MKQQTKALSEFGGGYQPRGPSPLTRGRLFESPTERADDLSSNFDRSNYNKHDPQPLNINIRSNLLDQMNLQYEENNKGNNRQNRFDSTLEREEIKDARNSRERSQNHNQGNTEGNNSRTRPKRTNNYPSPYAQGSYNNDYSLSPNRDQRQIDGFEETIQGNIDGQMTEQQIKNKKAFVWAFGKNQEGELALGVYKDALLPRFVTGNKGITAKFISSSNHHTAMITQDGQLLVSGSALHGKLGIEGLTKTNINKFQIVPTLARKRAKQVACGDYHTIVLMEDCTVYQFGGSLFKDKKDKISRPDNPKQQIPPNVPQPVQSLYGRDIIQIDCGDFHSAALDANGDLYTWGGGAPSYNKGQCGLGHTNAIEYPEKVKYLASKRIVKVVCGGFHTLVLTTENELYGFGSGIYGEVGTGEYLDTSKPKLVKFPNDHVLNAKNQVTEDLEEYGHDEEFVLEMYLKEQPQIVDVVAGGRHSLVVTNKGRLYSFGYGQNGQLGLRNTSNYSKPQLVKDLAGVNVVQVAAGWNHSMALTDRGEVYTCGYGGHGQLGLGDKESKTQFTLVQSLGNKNVQKIFAGGSHSWIVLDSVVPVKDQWQMQQTSTLPQGARSGLGGITPNKGYDSIGKASQISPYQSKHPESSEYPGILGANNTNKMSTMSQATFGGRDQPDETFRGSQLKSSQPLQENKSQPQQTQLIPSGDDFIQKIIEIQQQQLLKAQFYLQVTFCETEFCHRFVNFEVHGQFVKQFEALLEEYIQQQYSQEKGVLYHKIQEVPQEFMSRKKQSGNNAGQLKENQFDGFNPNDDYSDLDDSFTPEEGHKGYTLCLICNPAACSYDDQFEDYKRSQGLMSGQKGKKIIVNSSSFQAQASKQGENQNPLIGKIVFIKDTDVETNHFEEQISKWMINFHRKLAKYCLKKPRYSELRPMKFSLT